MRNEAELGSWLSELGVQTPNPVLETPPILPDVEMTLADQTSKNQSTTAKPDAKTSAKNSQKDKKSPDNEVTQILTGYEAVGDEQEQIRDIIVYDIPYIWDLQKILAELKFWGNTIKCSTTDLGGIPVRWLPASWKQREKFQAVIHDILEDMTMATLWTDRKPNQFLMYSGASAFKIIQTSKGKRKLIGYFENWETTLKVLDSPPVSLLSGKELKWCRHSIPNLKKARKLKTKKTPDMKTSGKAVEGSPRSEEGKEYLKEQRP
ncbi:hypothetical protein RhiirC2_798170 [Rhizophagus irregularis]|uniref:Uncharacterized protein n=1 Tax=Rhizophagus irregularis TaxID=588596 RepID=A0A2N1M6W7_9GLOM|nr:hypothetical protein RhiirC2_798170 [Rhizophagus irregularis]